SNSSNVYFNNRLDSLIVDQDRNSILLSAEVLDNEDNLLSSNILYFSKIANLNLPVPNIKYNIEQSDNGFIISMATDKLAKNIFLSTEKIEGKFSDNYFDLLPNQNVEIEFVTTTHISMNEFKKNLKVVTIRDSY
ncbi:MAG: hypothetical protein B7C24_08120, partial [Bacteroidetes bacterium 4572_77]